MLVNEQTCAYLCTLSAAVYTIYTYYVKDTLPMFVYK